MHPLAVAAAMWTTNEDMLTRAREIGAELDRLVAEAVAQTAATPETRGLLTEAARQLDVMPQWFVTNMPGPSFTRYYEQQRRALYQRAVALFGARDGQLIAPRLEYEAYVPARSLWR